MEENIPILLRFVQQQLWVLHGKTERGLRGHINVLQMQWKHHWYGLWAWGAVGCVVRLPAPAVCVDEAFFPPLGREGGQAAAGLGGDGGHMDTGGLGGMRAVLCIPVHISAGVGMEGRPAPRSTPCRAALLCMPSSSEPLSRGVGLDRAPLAPLPLDSALDPPSVWGRSWSGVLVASPSTSPSAARSLAGIP